MINPISTIDNATKKIKSPYLLIDIDTNNSELKESLNKLRVLLTLSDATRKEEYTTRFFNELENILNKYESEADYIIIKNIVDKMIELGGQAKEMAIQIKGMVIKKGKQIGVEKTQPLMEESQKRLNQELKKRTLESAKKVALGEPMTDKQKKEMVEIVERTTPVIPIVDKETESNEELIEEAMLEAKMREKAKRKQESEIIFDESMLEEYYKLKRIAYDAAECNPHHTHVEEFYEGMNACRKAIDVLDSFKKIAPIELLKKESGIIEELLSTLRRRLFIAEEEEVQRRRNRNR